MQEVNDLLPVGLGRSGMTSPASKTTTRFWRPVVSLLNSQAANSMSTLPRDSFRMYGAVLFAAAACAHAFQFILQWRFLEQASELGILTSPFFAWLQIS